MKSIWHRPLLFAAILALVCGMSGAATAAVAPSKPVSGVAVEEFVGPFPSWGNVKTRYGAVGNGTADDTAALQKALDEVGNDSAPLTIYLPAGTYRITKQLNLVGKKGVGFIGQDSSNTKIVWGGPVGGNMFVTDGSAYIRYGRITWDGRNKAAVGVAHWYYTPSGHFASTVHEHSDEVYMNMQKCLVSGKQGNGYGQMDSEIAVFRGKFSHCSVAGLSTESFNALDVWVWDSEFSDNGRAITNEFGAGNFSVYRSLFLRSTVADVTVKNTQFFSFRNNVSINSKMFLQAQPMGANTASTTIQGNHIIDTISPVAIDVGNMGPLMLIDNQIRSRTGAAGPAVRVNSQVAGCSLLSVGNVYTVQNAKATTCASARNLSSGDRVVAAASIKATVPVLPHAPVAKHQVFEVPDGANDAQIQAAIAKAAASRDQRPVVHFSGCSYPIARTLTVPANRPMQLVGDSETQTSLAWSGGGAGLVLQLAGPTKATLRELTVDGAEKAQGIVVGNANQRGARVYSEFSFPSHAQLSELWFDNVPNVRGELHGNVNYGSDAKTAAVRVNGASDVAIFGGGETVEAGGQVYAVDGGGKLFVADTWYEGAGERQVKLTGSATFTMQGAHIAPADSVHGGVSTQPSIAVSGLRGSATFIGVDLDLENAVDGVSVGQLPAGSMATFFGITSTKANWFESNGNGAALSAAYVNSGNGAQAISGVGAVNVSALNHLRTRKLGMPSALPSGVTDFRTYRVQITNTTNAIHIQAK